MSEKPEFEAVQFKDWRPWHAVNPTTDRTFCGINPLGAKRMWFKWAEVTDRCKRCLAARRSNGDFS